MSVPLRILLIEDCEDDALLILRELKQAGYEPIHERVDSLLDLEAALDGTKVWDVVTGDYAIPGFNGLAALAFLRARGVDVPFIIVSGKIGEEVAVEAMRHGAGDYVLKNNLQRLPATIERELREAEIRRKQKLAEEELLLERERLGDVATHANCGLLLLDDEARVVYANRLAEKWFGKTKRLKGRPSREIFNLIDERECPVSQAIQRSAIVNSDVPVATVKGERKYVHVSAAPLRDGNGTVKQVTAVLVDITERKQAEQLSEAMNDIRTAIGSTLDFDRIAQMAVAKSVTAVGCDTAIIALREDNHWVIKYLAGYPFLNIGSRFDDDVAGAAGVAEETLAPIAVNDTAKDERIDKKVIAAFGARSYLGCPLVVRDKAIGWLGFVNVSEPMFFTQAQIDFGAKIASSVALASENARLFAKEREARRLSEALTRIDAAITSTLDFDEVIQRVVDETQDALGYGVTGVNLREGDHWVQRYISSGASVPAGMEFSDDQVPLMTLVEKTGETVLVGDGHADARLDLEAMKKYPVHSYVAAPLRVQDRFIGVLGVGEQPPAAFTAQQADFISKVAASVSLALENIRLFEAESAARRKEEERSQRLEILHYVTGIRVPSMGLAEFAKHIVDGLYTKLDLTNANIYLHDRQKDELVPASGTGYPPGFFEKLSPIKVDTPTEASQVFTAGKPLIVEDINTIELTPHSKAAMKKFRLKVGSYIVMPLIASNEKLGVMTLTWPIVQAFAQDSIDFYVSLANEIAIILENARLFEAEVKAEQAAQAELELSNLLLKAADTLAGSLKQAEILESLANLTALATNRRRVTINTIDNSTNDLVIAYCRGLEGNPVGSRLSLDELSPALVSAITRKNHFSMNFTNPRIKTTASSRRRAKQLNCKAALFVPLIVNDKVIGALSVDEPGDDREFSEREIRLVQGIATQASVAIERARLYQKEYKAKELGEALNEINTAISSTLDFDEIGQRVVSNSLEALDCDSATIVIRANDHWAVRFKAGIPMTPVGTRFSDEEASAVGLTDQARKPFIVTDAWQDERVDRAFAETLGVRAFLNFPLIARKTVIGALGFGYRSGPVNFTKAQVDFGAKLAVSVSLALENARLYKQQREISETLQDAMLTMPKEVPGIQLGHLYRSATETARVGGDFYDVFDLGKDRVAMVIGDVSGKGLEAATLTSLVKNLIKVLAFQKFLPASVMTKANEIIFAKSVTNHFISAFYGLLNVKTGVLIFCNAGHPPPILRKAAGATSPLPISGSLPLGVLADHKYKDKTVSLKPGDILTLYTDGAVEARCGQEFFGEERLIKLIGTAKQWMVADIPPAVLETTLDFTGGALADDLALLAVSLGNR